MLKRLPPREREIVDLLYERGDLTVAEISESLIGQPSGSAVRTMLSRLEHKGFVRRTDSSKGYLYRPAVPDSQARKTALKELVRVFFHGSSAGAAFLSHFVGKTPWVHLDIAGTAWGAEERDYQGGSGGTGVGVRLLVRWLESRAERPRARARARRRS